MTVYVDKPLATTQCQHCGSDVVFMSVRDGQSHRKVALDPRCPVFMRIAEDPDTEPRSAFWIELTKPPGEARPVALAQHRCKGRG